MTKLHYIGFTLSVLLCPVSDQISIEQLLERAATAGLSDIIHPRIAKVSRHAPLTRAQFDAWRTLWPMNFRENRERQVILSDYQ
jgi:tRNA-specific adenosine deaminase 3